MLFTKAYAVTVARTCIRKCKQKELWTYYLVGHTPCSSSCSNLLRVMLCTCTCNGNIRAEWERRYYRTIENRYRRHGFLSAPRNWVASSPGSLSLSMLHAENCFLCVTLKNWGSLGTRLGIEYIFWFRCIHSSWSHYSVIGTLAIYTA